MLKCIGPNALTSTSIREVQIPDHVLELGDNCFSQCEYLARVTFSPCSSLERIGAEAFSSYESWGSRGVSSACIIEHISIPDSVRELGDKCFYG